MNIRCLLSHDNEYFGAGIKLLDIIEKAVNSKVEKFNMEMHKDKILYVVKELASDDIFPSSIQFIMSSERAPHLETVIIKDAVCLRCGKIIMVIKLCRDVMERRAEKIITKIMINEKRQAKANEMLDKAGNFSKCI